MFSVGADALQVAFFDTAREAPAGASVVAEVALPRSTDVTCNPLLLVVAVWARAGRFENVSSCAAAPPIAPCATIAVSSPCPA